MMTHNPSLEEIASVLDGGKLRNGSVRGCCPAHDGSDPSALEITYRDGKLLAICRSHDCRFEDIRSEIERRLGIEYEPPPKRREKVGTRTWVLLDLDGEEIARHVREDFDDGSKEVKWKRGGKWGLGGVKLRDMPLYGSEKLRERPEVPVVLTEGEKAADAAGKLLPDYVAIGTVTGAESAPSVEVLSCLENREVVLWPDNDDAGRRHMQRIAESLDGTLWLDWPDAPKKGDAADYVGDAADLADMIISRELPKPRPRTEKPGHDEVRNWWMEDFPHMAYSGGDWWAYGDGIWRRVDAVQVESQVISVCQGIGAKLTGQLVGSVMRLCRAAVFLPSDIWDQNPEILVCENGTLNLETRELRDWEQTDYVTSRVPYAYDPLAKAEVFEALLKKIIPESTDLVQEFAGYCLTTETEYETALWFRGPRGCGKSTVMEGLTAMLGPRSGILGLAEIEASPFALAKIPGKTLLTSTEQPASYLKSTHVIDALISGETLTVDRKYRDAEEVRPVAKILWAMNDLPRIGNTTSGIFRRIKIVEFPPLEGEPDPEVKRWVKEEGAGILNWALAGLRQLRKRDGFYFPPSVLAATEAFEHSNDLPSQFVEERCITGPDQRTASGNLYSNYREWAIENGHYPTSSNRVNDDWVRLGFTQIKNRGRRFWVGVALRYEQ